MKFELAYSKHGMPVYVYTMPHVASVSMGILIHAGTRDEQWPKEAGLAHAFEHMLFQGNRRKRNSKLISEEIEADGGNLNAWTDSEATFVHRKVPAYAFILAAQSLASQLSSPLCRPEDIGKEMKNIVEEIKRSMDDPASVACETLKSLVFGSHPLGRETLGIEESVRSFTRNDFFRWQEEQFHYGNYVCIVAGNITTGNALRVINRLTFGGERKERTSRTRETPNHVVASAVVRKDIKQANIALGTVFGPSDSASTEALAMYNFMINGGMSFPLFQEVRDKHGLCYTVTTYFLRKSDAGLFALYVGTDHTKIAKALECMQNVTWTYRNSDVQFQKAMRLRLGGIAIGYTDPSQILSSAAWSIIYRGFPETPDESSERVRRITLQDVTSAVERYLSPGSFSIAYVVPQDTKLETS